MPKKLRVRQIEDIAAGDVYLQRDLKVTTKVGEIKSFDDGQNYATVSATKPGGQKKTVQEAIEEIFSKDANPKVTLPSITIKPQFITDLDSGDWTDLLKDLYVEVGADVAVKASVVFSAGSYEFGPDPTHCEMQDSSLFLKSNLNDEEMLPDEGGIMGKRPIDDGEILTVAGTASYSEGLTPSSQLGNPVADLKIAAGSASAMSHGLRAFLKSFYGACPTSFEDFRDGAVESDDFIAAVRALSGNQRPLADGDTFEMTAGNKTKSFILAVPNDPGREVSITAVLPDSLGAVVNDFESYNHFGMKDAAGRDTSIDYTIFWWTPESVEEGTRVRITVNIA